MMSLIGARCTTGGTPRDLQNISGTKKEIDNYVNLFFYGKKCLPEVKMNTTFSIGTYHLHLSSNRLLNLDLHNSRNFTILV